MAWIKKGKPPNEETEPSTGENLRKDIKDQLSNCSLQEMEARIVSAWQIGFSPYAF